MPTGNRPTAVELFAGVGGFALGLEGRLRGFDPGEGWDWARGEGPWDVKWANQWEPSTQRQDAASGYRARVPETPLVDADIDVILDWELSGEEGRAPREALDRLMEHALTRHVPSRGPRLARERAALELAHRWTAATLPERFDLLVGGFPCQDYSVAQSLNRSSGIVGPKGVLWWQIERILRHRRPTHVLLENVDRLLKSPTTERGRDFAIMLATFAFHGYAVEWRVINAAHHGLPQRRRRVFIYASRTKSGTGQDPAFRPEAEVVLESSGLFAETFPCVLDGDTMVPDLLSRSGLRDPKGLSEGWGPRGKTPWSTAGYMRGGEVLTAHVVSPKDDRHPAPVLDRSYTLGDMLLEPQHVLKDPKLREFLIPTSQLDVDAVPARKGTWDYLKGPKRDPRTAAGGFAYSYSEGGIAFPEPVARASRTIVTGEGGRSPSRFKLVVEQEVPSEFLGSDASAQLSEAVFDRGGRKVVYRRLTPIELERLNMFPDGWTAPVGGDSRRAFTMGNALVVGIVERLGRAIARRVES